MVTKKIGPRNLPGIKKHFEKRKKCIEEKLRASVKKQAELEADLALAEDGLQMCENFYATSKVDA